MQCPRSLWTWNGRLQKPEQPATEIRTSKTESTDTRSYVKTNLYYYRARFYDPAKGRFITRDPKGYVDGLNLYAFVANNPVNILDPEGMEDDDDRNKDNEAFNALIAQAQNLFDDDASQGEDANAAIRETALTEEEDAPTLDSGTNWQYGNKMK